MWIVPDGRRQPIPLQPWFPLALRASGPDLQGRTRILRRNFRSTWEIVAATNQILQNDPEYDTETLEQDFRHYGVPPVVYATSGSEDQAGWIAQQVYGAARELRLPLNSPEK